MSSQYFPPYGSTNNIKVELDLANYATKDDVKNITHVDVSSYATKTNLAALKSEVDKIDVDKLKTTPADLAKLSNLVKNDVVEKTGYNTKVTSIENQIADVTKNTVDNLADITKLKAVYTSNFVLKTKLTADVNIDTVDKKILTKQTGDTHYIYRNELNKACFQHDSAYADNKDLINSTKSDKVLRDKAYNIASNPKYDAYQRGLVSMVYKFFDKKSIGSGTAEPSSLEHIAKASSLKLADELHKPVIRKFNKRKVYSQFKDNIWGVDLADTQSLSKKIKVLNIFYVL